MALKTTIAFCILFFYNLMAFPDTIITLNSGKVIVFKGHVQCEKMMNTLEEINCKDGVVVLENNGLWRNWIKEHYTPHNSYFKIKRGKIKVLNEEKTMYYKKWFLGKKIIIGNLEN